MSERFVKLFLMRLFVGRLMGCAVSVLFVAGLFVVLVVARIAAAVFGWEPVWPVVLALILYCVSVPGMVLLVVIGLFWRRNRQLDAAFGPLGLAGSYMGWTGRHYQGAIGGRRVDAFFHRGPTLRLYVDAAVRTRAAVAVRDRAISAVGGLVNHQAVEIQDPQLQHLYVSARDHRWASALVANPRVTSPLLRLMAQPPGYEVRNLILQPGAVHMSFKPVQSPVDQRGVTGWLQDMFAVAEAAEALPAPAVVEEPTGLDRMARKTLVTPAMLAWVAVGTVVLTVGGGLLIAALMLLFGN